MRGQRKCFTVDGGSAHDKHLFLIAYVRKALFERTIYLTPGQLCDRLAQHDVASPGQRAVGQRGIGLAPHEHGVTPGQLLEAGKILRDMPGERAVGAYGTMG